ncbi:MAG: hypothetical protein AAFO62_04500, partial [Pseudomonadota bacterium]
PSLSAFALLLSLSAFALLLSLSAFALKGRQAVALTVGRSPLPAISFGLCLSSVSGLGLGSCLCLGLSLGLGLCLGLCLGLGLSFRPGSSLGLGLAPRVLSRITLAFERGLAPPLALRCSTRFRPTSTFSRGCGAAACSFGTPSRVLLCAPTLSDLRRPPAGRLV